MIVATTRIIARLIAVLALATALACPATAQQPILPNLELWERDAARAEAELAEDRASNLALEQLRTQIADWRTRFTEAQSANSARIETLRSQIGALGPPPAEGETETEQIAARRKALNDELARLQAPGLTAVEALSRAESLISQIDRRIRERQASALLRLFPTPLNPVNWPAGLAVLTQGLKTLGTEVSSAWSTEARRAELKNNIPFILLLLAVAAVLVWKGPGFIERQSQRLLRTSGLRARTIAAALLSLGQIAVPVVGMVLLSMAALATGMLGLRLGALTAAVPIAAFAFFAAHWLGSWLFREGSGVATPSLSDRPAEARFLAGMIGLVYGLELFRRAFTTEVRPPLSLAAQSVWGTPLVCLVAVFVFRLGMLLRKRKSERAQSGEADLFRDRLISLIGTASVVVSLVAPALALIGYVTAANALIWPTVLSLGLIGLIILLQRFSADIYLIVTRSDESRRDSLLPVLAGFALSILALPVLALIWGARTTDLSEIWQRFLLGVSIGDTRISPVAFLTFAAIFAAGYALTRLIQNAIKTSVLPRTSLDKGVQNAVSAGIGYVGIFLAALVAINGAGINLSSLAIVAGALSVGIGFGLQNIVQNFVSGIILLIERPISEGDMIEVGGKTGIVKAISVRSTRIETFDRSDLVVPNADLVSGVVTNWTRSNSIARLIIPVGVAYGSDTRKVEKILLDIADDQPTVLIEPPPAVVFTGFGADSLNFEIRMLVSDLNLRGDVQTEVNHQIVERFAAEGIDIPFAQRDVWLRNPEALLAPPPERRARKPASPPDKGGKRPSVNPAQVRNDPNEGEDPERI